MDRFENYPRRSPSSVSILSWRKGRIWESGANLPPLRPMYGIAHKTIRNSQKLKTGVHVYFGNDCVTPKLLPVIDPGNNDLYSYTELEERSTESNILGHATIYHGHTAHRVSIATETSSKKSSAILKEDEEHELFRSIDDSFYGIFSSSNEEDDFYNQSDAPMPDTIHLTISETCVISLLEMTSTTDIYDSKEGGLAEVENEIYDLMVNCIGCTVSCDASSQTRRTWERNKKIMTEKPPMQNKSVTASTAAMYDAYTEEDSKEKSKVMDQSSQISEEESKSKCKITDSRLSIWDDQHTEKLIQNPSFQLQVMFVERALANNTFNEEQNIFHGITGQDPFRLNVEFKYTLNPLWTFQTPETEGTPIVCMQWHPTNPDILACGYGKFYYLENKPGIVYCWNIKNPTSPERKYHFEKPVTCLKFSPDEPNLMTVGLYDGTVAILDIAPREVQLVTITEPDATLCDPIWDLEWFDFGEDSIMDRHLLSASESGTISSYIGSTVDYLERRELFKLIPKKEKIEGIYYPKDCTARKVPICKDTPALKIQVLPSDQTVFWVATSDGTIHKCSENYLDQSVDRFKAHYGPIYNIQFSKYCSKLFLTCGFDSCIRVWIEEIKEPLVTLKCSVHQNPIDCAEWCPSNPTIIANVCANRINIWDLQRRTHAPASIYTNPRNIRNTIIRFCSSGRNLAVGDVEGFLHIYALEDVPFPPFYPRRLLEEVMFRNLRNRPDLVDKVKQFGLVHDVVDQLK